MVLSLRPNRNQFAPLSVESTVSTGPSTGQSTFSDEQDEQDTDTLRNFLDQLERKQPDVFVLFERRLARGALFERPTRATGTASGASSSRSSHSSGSISGSSGGSTSRSS